MSYLDKVAKIVSNKSIAKDVYECVISCTIPKDINPGQFVTVSIGIEGMLLKRPFAISEYTASTITIIYKVYGKGTEWMGKQKPGTVIQVLGPFGNGYPKFKSKKILIIAGSVGVPPLYSFVKEQYKNNDIEVMMGFNSKQDCFYKKEFLKLTKKVSISTMDGTEGFKGSVVDLIKNKKPKFDYFICCGNNKMMEAVQKQIGTEGYFSLEARMGCGFGACNSCGIKLRDGSLQKVCLDGPVFKSSEVNFND